MPLKPLGNNLPAAMLGALYGAACNLRNWYFNSFANASRQSGRPTISIGGIHAGGTGKTPTALLTAQTLAENGYTIAFLSRGYGRTVKKNILVSPGEQPDWKLVGDEPALLHAAAPDSWLGISANRIQSARALSGKIPEKAVFILDDGFQHRNIKRELDIVCLPPDPFNDRLIPSGLMREPINNLKRAGMVVFISSGENDPVIQTSRDKLLQKFPDIPIFILKQVIQGWVNLQTGETVVTPPLADPALICAIARPERFLSLIDRQKLAIGSKHFFYDHHVFTHTDINYIPNAAARGIITTEKDAFRLQAICRDNAIPAWFIRIRLAFENQDSKTHFKMVLNKKLFNRYNPE